MKQQKTTIIILILSLIFFFGMIGCIVQVLNTKNTLSKTDISEFTAIIDLVEINGTGDNQYITLYTKEYGEKLKIQNTHNLIKVNEILNLAPGETIYFGIENNMLDQFEACKAVSIVSLRTNETVLISLNEYNEQTTFQRIPAILAGVTVCGILLFISFYCILRLKKKYNTDSEKLKSKKLLIIMLSLSFLIFIAGVSSLIAILDTNKNLSETDTTEFFATAMKVEIEGSGSGAYGTIYTEEYGGKLKIRNINQIQKKNELLNLKSGQTVYFRIENGWLNQFEIMEFVYIVSLRTEKNELLSLNVYNQHLEAQRTTGMIVSILICAISLFFISSNISKLRKVYIAHKVKKDLSQNSDFQN